MTILLLTDIPPCMNYTAGIFLNHLVNMIPENNIVCFTVLNPELKPEIPPRIEFPIKTVDKPRENWGYISKIGPLVSFVMETLIETFSIPKISHEVAAFARAHNVDAIWCTLEGQSMIRLACQVARETNLPLYTQVWDTPGWWMRAWKVNPTSARRVIKDYEKVIQASACCGAASWAMAEEYQASFGIKCVPLVSCLEKGMALEPAREPKLTDGVLRIGLAGQIYARDTWDAFIAALDSVNWKICEYPVQIKVLGQWLDPALNRPEIEFLGWHSQQETIEILSQLDVLYCPYWFDKAFEQEARFSFPSKVTTYLAAGRPVFFHGPEYSSPGRFLKDGNAGVCCHSAAPSEIIQQLNDLIRDEKFYGAMAQNGHQLFLEKLSFEALRENLYRFLPLERQSESQ